MVASASKLTEYSDGSDSKEQGDSVSLGYAQDIYGFFMHLEVDN
jgi:hypothetical protein